jgi:hypothetical protein
MGREKKKALRGERILDEIDLLPQALSISKGLLIERAFCPINKP